MGVTGKLTITAQVGGDLEVIGTLSFEESSQVPKTVVTLAAGKAGALTTRSGINTGELTMGAGHGIPSGATIDLFWPGGSQHNITVGTVDGLAVPIDLGVGDDLPADETAIVACVQTEVNIDFPGTALSMIGVKATGRAGVDFQQGDGTSLKYYDVAAGALIPWGTGLGSTTPIAGLVGKVMMSSGDTDGTTVTIMGLFDSLA